MCATAAVTSLPQCGARRISVRQWVLSIPIRCAASSNANPAVDVDIDVDSAMTTGADSSASASGGKSSSSFFPKKNQTLELVCESLGFKGKGICKAADTGFVLMCDRALPGERFIGRVTRKKSSYAEVKKLKTIVPHHHMVEAPCQYASYCGGCKTQNLSYEAQIKYKEQQVHDLIVHVGRFDQRDPKFADVIEPIVPCQEQYHYRNKFIGASFEILGQILKLCTFIWSEFSFGTDKWVPDVKEKSEQGSALGLHAPGFFDKVLDVDKCLLQSEAANKVLAIVQENWRDPNLSLSPYNVHTHSGFLKHLMIRTGRNNSNGFPELMVNFVTSSYKPELLEPLVEKITTIPEVVSVMNNVNTSVGNTSVGEQEYTLYGKSAITEMLRGLSFEISANSFFQTNTKQADVLYEIIEECAGLRGDGSEIVLDLFCGTGTIGLTLARRARHVYGYEVVPEAILDARRNAELNNIHNATFIQGDLNKINDSFGKEFPRPDIIISDPNRPGMHMKLIKYLLKVRAPRLVYVSCNPATCARDLDYICHGVSEQGLSGCYQLKRITPVDMFPNTPHIECVCLLELA
ncbi:hypothetical protein LUZ61_006021 [Rhynchospora tenuis]|uniref:TRAM domain-containing protein n=1 Tax=Rhynchospora tenuis TaxID=198213 RepID=A0AAD5ZQR5_9POAL|nr:hypothetical protein LUZ61_006021 [Rhynchospora tenuis]